MISESGKLTPPALTCTTTSPAAGRNAGTFSTTSVSGKPNRLHKTALMHPSATSSLFLEKTPHQRFGDKRRLLLALDCDGHDERQLQTAGDLFHLGQDEAALDTAVSRHRAGEAYLVQPIVDAHVAEGQRIAKVVLVELTEE